jgi:anti-anti-sigma regulatory factor
MLKITLQQGAVQQGAVIVLEGRLAGPWVEELRASCRVASESQQQCTMIDLTGVTFIDADGKALLASLWQQGVELRASGCLTTCVVEEISRLERCASSKETCRKQTSSRTDDQS